MDSHGLGPELPGAVLLARSVLPIKPAPIELESPSLRVRPFDQSDALGLYEIANGEPVARLGNSVDGYDAEEEIWKYMPFGPFASASALGDVHSIINERPNSRVFCVVDGSTDQLIGSVSLISNEPQHLKIEIGAVWYTPAVHNRGVNAEVVKLFAAHVFGLGYRRFEWKCHADNVRSRRAAVRSGFTFEGIHESHTIQRDRSRDTAWYRVLVGEWESSQPFTGPE